IIATALVVLGWGGLIWTGSISTIWPMFGIANQLLAVIALTLVTTWLVRSGRAKYAWVTVLPMLWVIATTLTAAVQLVTIQFPEKMARVRMNALTGVLSTAFTVFVVACVATLLLLAVARWLVVLRRLGAFKETA